jgi:hypothetical protein
MQVVVRGPLSDVVLVDAFRASAGDRELAMPPQRAASWMRGPWSHSIDAHTLARLHTAAVGGDALPSPSGMCRHDLLRRVTAALEEGRLLAIERPRRAVIVQLDDDPEPVLGPDNSDVARVDFFFDFSDGTAVRDLGYVLEDSSGARTKGKLPKDGSVSRAPASGTYTVSLKEIDSIAWQPARILAGGEARIAASATGLDDGSAGKVRVYRLYQEDEADAVATLTATLADGRAEASWKHDPTKTAGPPPRDGLALFVAELSFEDGTVWKKTDPLVVELPGIASLAWSQPVHAPEEQVTLLLQTTGFSDAAQVKVTLHGHVLDGDDASLGDVPGVALSGGTARIDLSQGQGALPASTDDVYATVTVSEAGVERKATSPILRVHAWKDDDGDDAPPEDAAA